MLSYTLGNMAHSPVNYYDFFGEWDANKYYAIGHMVVYGGKTYRATTLHYSGSTTEPGVGASWAVNWVVYADDETIANNVLFHGCLTSWQGIYMRIKTMSPLLTHPTYGGTYRSHTTVMNARQRLAKCVPILAWVPVGFGNAYNTGYHHVDIKVLEADYDTSVAGSDPVARSLIVQSWMNSPTTNGTEIRGTLLEFNNDILVQQISIPNSAEDVAAHSVAIPTPVKVSRSWFIFYNFNTTMDSNDPRELECRAAFGSIVGGVASAIDFHKGYDQAVGGFAGKIGGTVFVVTDISETHFSVQHQDVVFTDSETAKNITLASSIDITKSFLLSYSEQANTNNNEQQIAFTSRLFDSTTIKWERTAASGVNYNDGKITYQVITFADSTSRVERFYQADATGATTYDFNLAEPHAPLPIDTGIGLNFPEKAVAKGRQNYTSGTVNNQVETAMYFGYFINNAQLRLVDRGDSGIRHWLHAEVLRPQRARDCSYNKFKNFVDDNSFNQYIRRLIPMMWYGKFSESLVGSEMRDMSHFYHNLDRSGPTHAIHGTPVRVGHDAINFASHAGYGSLALWQAGQTRYVDRGNQISKVVADTDEFTFSMGLRVDSAISAASADRTFFLLGNDGGSSISDRGISLHHYKTGNQLRISSADSGGIFITADGTVTTGGKYIVTFHVGNSTGKIGYMTINGVQQTGTWDMSANRAMRSTRTFTFGVNTLGVGGHYSYIRNGWSLDHIAFFRRGLSSTEIATIHSRWMAEAGI